MINLQSDGMELVTNIQTAADAKESGRRTEEEEATRLRSFLIQTCSFSETAAVISGVGWEVGANLVVSSAAIHFKHTIISFSFNVNQPTPLPDNI